MNEWISNSMFLAFPSDSKQNDSLFSLSSTHLLPSEIWFTRRDILLPPGSRCHTNVFPVGDLPWTLLGELRPSSCIWARVGKRGMKCKVGGKKGK